MPEANENRNVGDTERPPVQRNKRTSVLRDHLVTVFSAILLSVTARSAVAESRYIPSESMVPTLKVQDRLVIEKLSGHFVAPQRGDILVFDHPASAEPQDWQAHLKKWQGVGAYTPLIKRVVGLPGEVIEIRQGQVFINGESLSEDYLQEAPRYSLSPFLIPDNHVFMLGDNRNNSADSHVWGPLPLDHVRGKAVFRLWPLQRAGLLHSAP